MVIKKIDSKALIRVIVLALLMVFIIQFNAYADNIVSSGSRDSVSWTVSEDGDGHKTLSIDSSFPLALTQRVNGYYNVPGGTYYKIVLGANISSVGSDAFYNLSISNTVFYFLGDTSFPSENKFLTGTTEDCHLEPDYDCVWVDDICHDDTPGPGCPSGDCYWVCGQHQVCTPNGSYHTECSTIDYYETVPESHIIRIVLESVSCTYTGEAVTEKLNADPADFSFTAHYNTKTVTHKGSASFVSFVSLKVTNLVYGQNIYWTFTDPETGTVVTGTVNVPCKKKVPVALSASYSGNEVVEGLKYDPAALVVTVTYNNGDSEKVRASGSDLVGTYASNTWSFTGKGDVDQNTVLNDTDYKNIDAIITGGETMTDAVKAQADITNDGLVDGNDLSQLEAKISRVCSNVGTNTFYVSYSNLLNKSQTAPQYASFTVKTVKKTPYKVSVFTKPTKTVYVDGENFDPSGMVLVVYYDNGTIDYVPVNGINDPVSVEFGDAEHTIVGMPSSQTEIPIFYTENKKTVETSLKIIVGAHRLTSIKITQAPAVTTYYDGENFNANGMVINAYYDEGVADDPISVEIPVLACVLSNNKKLKDSRDYIYVKDSAAVDPDQTYIQIAVSKLTSSPGTELGTSGTFVYFNGTSKSVTGTVAGNWVLKISYTDNGIEKHTYQPITVLYPRLSGLSILSNPRKTEYVAGQDFDTTGLVLKASYTNGSTAYIYADSGDGKGYTILNGESLSAGTTEVEAIYTENGFMKSVSVPVIVEDPAIESISAVYTGKNVYVGSKFKKKDVTIYVTYTDGKIETTDGTHASSVVPVNDDGEINASTPEDLVIHEKGENLFGVIYSGKKAQFTVTGIEQPVPLQYNSVARGKSYYATWSEQFSIKRIRTVNDFILGEVGENGTTSEDDFTSDASGNEYHITNKMSSDDSRTYLDFINGTGKGYDSSIAAESPIFHFLRESDNPVVAREISISYRGRTKGYLFPDSGNASLANNSERGYIDAYGQNPDLYNSTSTIESGVGWSDWVKQGDSIGTVKSERKFANYTVTTRDDSSEATYLSAMSFKLVNAPASAGINISVEDADGNTHVYGQNEIIYNPAKIKFELNGTIGSSSFEDAYKIYYRASVDDAVGWSTGGEWVGTSGTHMETIEVRLVLKNEDFNTGSNSNVPVIVSQPKRASKTIGDDVAFSVTVAGNESNVRYQWYRNGTILPGETSNTLRKENLTADDNNSYYFCRITAADSNLSTDTDIVLLTVTDIIPAITQDLSDAQVDPVNGVGSITLHTSANCKVISDLTFEWKRSADGINWSTVPADTSAAGSSSCTQNVTTAEGIVYIKCTISNTAGSVETQTVRVYATVEPVVKMIESRNDTENGTVYLGKDASVSARVTFTTQVENYRGDISYKWYFDGTLVSDNSTNTYIFSPASAGNHTLKVRVTCGSKIIDVERGIEVVDVKNVTYSYTYTINNGKYNSTVTLNSEYPNTAYAWYFDGVRIENAGVNYTLSTEGNHIEIMGLSNMQHTLVIKVTTIYGSTNLTLNMIEFML